VWQVFEAVAGISPVLEICCSRFLQAPYLDFHTAACHANLPHTHGALTTPRSVPQKQPAPWIIADGANAGAILRGDPQAIPELDIVGYGACVYLNGVKAREGIGQAVLGSPMKSLLWLANQLRHGPGLQAGAFISTGTMTGLLPVQPGDDIRVVFDELGEVCCSFASEEEVLARREAVQAAAETAVIPRRDSFGSLQSP